MNLTNLLVPTPLLAPRIQLPPPERCVHCKRPLLSAEQCRARLLDGDMTTNDARAELEHHVYPDGCVAHDSCYMADGSDDPRGIGTSHWHSVEACNEEVERAVRYGDYCPSGNDWEGEQ